MTCLSRDEAGCHQYQAHRAIDDPTKFFLYEVYVDEAAFEAHVSSEHFRAHVLNGAVPLLTDRRRDVYNELEI